MVSDNTTVTSFGTSRADPNPPGGDGLTSEMSPDYIKLLLDRLLSWLDSSASYVAGVSTTPSSYYSIISSMLMQRIGIATLCCFWHLGWTGSWSQQRSSNMYNSYWTTSPTFTPRIRIAGPHRMRQRTKCLTRVWQISTYLEPNRQDTSHLVLEESDLVTRLL